MAKKRIIGPLTQKQAAAKSRRAAARKGKRGQRRRGNQTPGVLSLGGSTLVEAPPMARPTRITGGMQLGKQGKMNKVHATCSLIDAFCTHADGAKYPDGSAARTLTFSATRTLKVTTGAGGVAVHLFAPDASPFFYDNQSPAANSWTPPATLTAGTINTTDFFTAYVGEVRLVSAAIEYHPILAATDPGGYVLISTVNPAVGLIGGAAIAGIPQPTLGNETTSIDIRSAHTWYSRRTDATVSKQLVTPLANNVRSGAWTGYLAQFQGPATKDLGYVTMKCNWEFTITPVATAVAQMARPGPTSDPHVEKMLAKVQVASSGLITQAKETAATKIEKFASDALDSVLSEGMAFLGLV